MTETDRLLARLWVLLHRLRRTETARVHLLDWDEPVGYDCRLFRWERVADRTADEITGIRRALDTLREG